MTSSAFRLGLLTSLSLSNFVCQRARIPVGGNGGWLVISSCWQPGTISICFRVSIIYQINETFVLCRVWLSLQNSVANTTLGAGKVFLFAVLKKKKKKPDKIIWNIIHQLLRVTPLWMSACSKARGQHFLHNSENELKWVKGIRETKHARIKFTWQLQNNYIKAIQVQ